jgi:hypothetical protein
MTDRLSILDGPTSVTVNVDKGIFGIPGSQFYLSNGDPNIPGNIESSTAPARYDLCINTDPADADYLYLYQYNYVPNAQILAWIQGFKLVPNTVAKNENATFTLGSSSIEFEIELPTGYSSGTGGVPENYDIQYEISTAPGTTTQPPVSATYAITGILVENGIATINMTFAGIELISGAWIPISGDKVIHLIITVV